MSSVTTPPSATPSPSADVLHPRSIGRAFIRRYESRRSGGSTAIAGSSVLIGGDQRGLPTCRGQCVPAGEQPRDRAHGCSGKFRDGSRSASRLLAWVRADLATDCSLHVNHDAWEPMEVNESVRLLGACPDAAAMSPAGMSSSYVAIRAMTAILHRKVVRGTSACRGPPVLAGLVEARTVSYSPCGIPCQPLFSHIGDSGLVPETRIG